MATSYYPPKVGHMNNDTISVVCLVAIAVAVWILVIAGTNAI